MVSSFQILSILLCKFILFPCFPLMSSYNCPIQDLFIFSLDNCSSHLTSLLLPFSLAHTMNSFYLSFPDESSKHFTLKEMFFSPPNTCSKNLRGLLNVYQTKCKLIGILGSLQSQPAFSTLSSIIPLNRDQQTESWACFCE